MALADIILDLNAARKFVEPDGKLTREVQVILAQLVDELNVNVDETNTGVEDAQNTADVKIYTFRQNTIPVDGDHPLGALETGDLWTDTNDQDRMYRYDGANFIDVRDGTIAIAQTQADFSGYTSTGDGMTWHTDETGTQPANNDTRDLIARFNDELGVEVATRTLRGTYTTAADTISVAAQSDTGELTTFVLNNNNTDSVQAIITHTDSGALSALTWSFLDETIAGTVPVTGGGK